MFLLKTDDEISREWTYHVLGQRWMNSLDKQVPPQLQEGLEMVVSWWCLHLFADWIEVLNPWFRLADEMKNFDVLVVPKIVEFD